MATVQTIGRAVPETAGAALAPADLTRALYERYARQIFAYCLVQLRNREEAEDAVQTTFLNAFRGLERGIVPELESAWLYKIAQHVCQTRQRSWSRRRQVESPEDFAAVQEVLGAPVQDSGELDELTDALRGLPEQQRRAILLREWKGLSYREIADEMELSQAAVETLIFRARRGLATALERLRTTGDMGSIAAAIKSILFGGGAKVAATLVTVATTSVVAATPEARHGVIHLVNSVAPAAPAKQHPATRHPAKHAATAVAAAAAAAAPVERPKPKPAPALHDPQRPIGTTKHAAVPIGLASTSDPVPADTPGAVADTPADAPAPKASRITPAVIVPAPAAKEATTTAAPTAPAAAPVAKTVPQGEGQSKPTTPPPPAAAIAPAVGGFTPPSGTPGTIVQIGGKGFTGATAVKFNGTSADFVVNADGQLSAKVPTGATSGPITVVTPNGTAAGPADFFVTTPAPVVNGTSPSSGQVGASVGIGGKGFTGATAVKFNGTSTEFTVNSDTLILTHVPVGATTGPITVVTPNGTVTSPGFTVTVAAPPTISGLNPSSGPVGASVGIGGSHFTGATSVKFNGVSAEFSVAYDGGISTHVPVGATTGPITVVTPNGTATSGAFTVTASAPGIEGFTPASGSPGTYVTIGGHGFTGATSVKFNGTSADFVVNSDGQIKATVPSAATSGPVTVTTPNGTATSSGGFTVTNAPGINGFSPASAAHGSTVSIGGHGFTGATVVKFNGVAASFTVNSDGLITAVVPSTATSGPVTVTTPNGTATSPGSFTVTG